LFAVALFGAGSPMISIGAPKTISLWFQGRSRGTAVGIYTTGPRIGGVLALSLTNSVVMPLTGNDWRVTFVCYGVLTFGFGLLWWFLARDTKPTIAEEGTGMMEVFKRLIRIRNVQIVLAMVLLAFATSHGFSDWLPNILEASGMSSTGAGFGASLPLVASIPAVIVIPRLIPSHLRGRFLAFFALLTIVTLLLVVSASGTLLLVGLTIFGIANSLVSPLLILILMDAPEVGSRYMGAAGGMFFCAGETGGFTGPLIMGTLVDITGSFLPGALFLVGLNLAILGMTLALKTQPAAGPQASP
jgi:cyanate permease